MNWKVILAVGVILLSGTISAQTTDSKTTKYQILNQPRFDSGNRWITDGRHQIVPYAEDVKRDRKSAERGDASAQFMLALRYDSGQGVLQDYAEAVKWLRKAAEHGYASAQKNLGVKYGNGQGVPQSDVEAYVWSSIAAISGDEGAKNNRDFAASKLSPEDLEAARIRAAGLYEQIQQRKG
jgi:TPR repeat protein